MFLVYFGLYSLHIQKNVHFKIIHSLGIFCDQWRFLYHSFIHISAEGFEEEKESAVDKHVKDDFVNTMPLYS